MITSTVDMSDILNSLLTRTGLNEAELARNVNLPRATINRLTSGKTPDPRASTLQAIAEYFNVSVGQLMGKEPLFFDNNKTLAANPAYSIPILEIPQAKAWEVVVEQLNPANHLQWIARDASSEKAKFAVPVVGDAMWPQFRENTLLIVDPLKNPGNRDFVIVHLAKADSVVFRQLVTEEHYKLLKAVNNIFPIITCEEKDKFIGTVIQTRSNYGN